MNTNAQYICQRLSMRQPLREALEIVADLCDQLEVPVVVHDAHSRELGRGGDDGVGERDLPVVKWSPWDGACHWANRNWCCPRASIRVFVER